MIYRRLTASNYLIILAVSALLAAVLTCAEARFQRHFCDSHLWTEQQIRDTISSKRNADWYPVARGTNYAVHTLNGDGIKAPKK